LIKSMTAYGRGEYHLGDTQFIAETRSLNNRHLDIILRIPRNYQVLEKELKDTISSRIRRGRVEVSVQIENNGEEGPYSLELNVHLVDSYIKILHQLAEQFDLDKKIQADSLLQMKDVLLFRPEAIDMDKLRPGFHHVVEQALDSLDMMRAKEGEAIEADFVKRLDLLENYVNEVDKRAPIVVEEYRKKLKDRIDHIIEDVALDESRLAQELAFFAEKSDITEEIVRTRSHLKQFREYLSMDDALGRRLDFLIQEINREVNTLSSKASDTLISKVVVEMKAELEKLREQVQNVE
jgi:uncharacterized protein (TIGR00255 family)